MDALERISCNNLSFHSLTIEERAKEFHQLIKNGTSIDSKQLSSELINTPVDGMSAVHVAILENKAEILRSFFPMGDFDLAWGDKSPRFLAAERGFEECLQALAIPHAKWDQPNGENSWTALHIASKNGYKDIVETLLGLGASPAVLSKDNKTALFLAAEAGHLECVHLLLMFGASINQMNGEKKETAIHIAAEKGHRKVVEQLLNHRCADSWQHYFNSLPLLDVVHVNARTKSGENCLDYARRSGDADLIKYLEEYLAYKPTPADLHRAVKKRMSDGEVSTQQLQVTGIFRDRVIKKEYGDIDTIARMLQVLIPDDLNTFIDGQTVLHLTQSNSFYTKLFIEHGADATLVSDKGETARVGGFLETVGISFVDKDKIYVK